MSNQLKKFCRKSNHLKAISQMDPLQSNRVPIQESIIATDSVIRRTLNTNSALISLQFRK